MSREYDIDAMTADAVAEMDWRLQGELRRAAPDFADAVRRAHQLAPEEVSAEHVARAGRVRLQGLAIHEPAESEGDLLSGHLEAAREQVEAEVEARRLLAIPPFVSPAPNGDRRVRQVVFAAAAAAAIVAVWIGPRVITAITVDEAAPASQAEQTQSERPATARAARTAPTPARYDLAPVRPGAPPQTAVFHEEPALGSSAGDDVVPKPAARRPQVAPLDRLAELDAQAQAHWRAGELDEAQLVFRTIIREAPRSHHAELAFGDLFTLTRRQADAPALETLWVDYLHSFPRGRFADDTRAELCARSTDTHCWSAYMTDFPNGAHLERARRFLDTTEPEPK